MKKTKWLVSVFCAVVIGITVIGVSGCKKSDHDSAPAHAHQYTCTMHPEVVQDAPGKCPKCEMALVEKH